MRDLQETCLSCVTDEAKLTVCSSETKWINKIIKLHESNPDEVEIVYYPQDNHGMIYARVPKNYLKLAPPRQVNYTDEQRAAMAERLAAAREKKQES